MVTCCQKESNIDDQIKDVKPFRFCVFSNDRSSASELWETCENPMCKYDRYYKQTSNNHISNFWKKCSLFNFIKMQIVFYVLSLSTHLHHVMSLFDLFITEKLFKLKFYDINSVLFPIVPLWLICAMGGGYIEGNYYSGLVDVSPVPLVLILPINGFMKLIIWKLILSQIMKEHDSTILYLQLVNSLFMTFENHGYCWRLWWRITWIVAISKQRHGRLH